MKLRNKKTGEIIENAYIRESHDFYNKRTIAVFVRDGDRPPERVSTGYESLAELNKEWCDYEEPKEYWYIEPDGSIIQNHKPTYINHLLDGLKSIGNYFETKEEAEQAVEKLKAWKRLKDKGFRFERWGIGGEYGNTITFSDYIEYNDETRADLDLLFGGEE